MKTTTSNHPIHDYKIYTVTLDDGSNWHMYNQEQVAAFTSAIADSKTPEQAMIQARFF